MKKTFDIKEIVQALPHRYPFLLVDKILEMDVEQGSILGQKNVTANEQFFQGHFPNQPIMPGVLILEALAQTGAFLLFHNANQGKMGVLLYIKDAKFRNPVRPGDILYLKGEGLHMSSKGGKIQTTATVNGSEKIAAQAEIGFALVEKDQI